jgi:hypothetical protein
MLHRTSITIVVAVILCCVSGCVRDGASTRENADNETEPSGDIFGDMPVSEQMLHGVKQQISMVRQSMSDDEIIDVLGLRDFGPSSNGTIGGITSSHAYEFAEHDCHLVIFRSYNDLGQPSGSSAYEIKFGGAEIPSSVTFKIPKDLESVR